MINIIKKEELLAYIQSRIYVSRGQKIMMDRDLAELYGVETRTLNQKVKRNLRRFPPDFMFQMNKEDIEEWKSQIVISNSIKMGLRKPPYLTKSLCDRQFYRKPFSRRRENGHSSQGLSPCDLLRIIRGCSFPTHRVCVPS